MTARWKVLVLLLVTALASSAAVAPAQADTKFRRDKVGDAPAAIDLTRVRVANGDARIVMTLRVRNLRKYGHFFLFYVFAPSASDGFRTGGEVEVARRAPAGEVRTVYWWRGDGVRVRRPCDGLRVRWNAARDFIRASIPQSCYAAHPVPNRWFFYVDSAHGRYLDESPEFAVRKG